MEGNEPVGTPLAGVPPPVPGESSAAPYTAAFKRHASSLRRRDLRGALAALDEAIALEPALGEAYHRRGLLWRLLGDYVGAARDYATCAALDPHYSDLSAIRQAARELFDAYSGDLLMHPEWDPSACRNPELGGLLEELAADVARRRALLARPSCNLPCPSLCCYFEDEMFEYGVHLERSELAAVRAYLRASNLAEDDYLARIERARCPSAIQALDGWFIAEEDGSEYLHYMRRTRRTAGTLTAPRPRTLSYAEPIWLTSRSRLCRFAGDGGCSIHEIGDPPGVSSCRRFLCLTAFVFLLLIDQGVTSVQELSGQSMVDLSEAALEALPRLAAEVSSPEAAAARAEARDALAAALAGDQAGEEQATREALERYKVARCAGEEAATRARIAAAAVARRHVARRT